MNEVKRYELTIEELGPDEDGYLEQFIQSSDGEYVKFTDFQSERAARIEAETKLKELEDAVTNHYDKMWHKSAYPLQDEIYEAIANSKARSKV